MFPVWIERITTGLLFSFCFSNWTPFPLNYYHINTLFYTVFWKIHSQVTITLFFFLFFFFSSSSKSFLSYFFKNIYICVWIKLFFCNDSIFYALINECGTLILMERNVHSFSRTQSWKDTKFVVQNNGRMEDFFFFFFTLCIID